MAMSEKWNLDRYCLKILLVMCNASVPMRFNELKNKLNPDEKHSEMSDPTLSDHLKHLVRDGYVTREEELVEHRLKVTYSLNYEKINQVKGMLEAKKKIESYFEKSKEKFLSLPVERQVYNILESLVQIRIRLIKACIDFGLNPKSFEKKFLVQSWGRSGLLESESWLVEKAVRNEKYRKEFLKAVDKLIATSIYSS